MVAKKQNTRTSCGIPRQSWWYDLQARLYFSKRIHPFQSHLSAPTNQKEALLPQKLGTIPAKQTKAWTSSLFILVQSQSLRVNGATPDFNWFWACCQARSGWTEEYRVISNAVTINKTHLLFILFWLLLSFLHVFSAPFLGWMIYLLLLWRWRQKS